MPKKDKAPKREQLPAGRSVKDTTAALRDRLASKFGKESVLMMGDGGRSEITDVIPFGLSPLDHWVLGVGGAPCKRLIEVFGGESAGKTSLLFSLIANAQRLGYPVSLVENENTLQQGRAQLFGVDPSEVILSQPNSLEEGLAYMGEYMSLLPGDTPSLLVWDSIAATLTKMERELGAGAATAIGLMARRMSQDTKALCQLAAQKNVAMVWVNQTRNKIGVKYGSPITTPGGEAVKFHAAARLQMYGGGYVKRGEEVIGRAPTIKAVKNKVGIPLRQITARLLYETGWDDIWTTCNFGKDTGDLKEKAKASRANFEQVYAANGWKLSDAPAPEGATLDLTGIEDADESQDEEGEGLSGGDGEGEGAEVDES